MFTEQAQGIIDLAKDYAFARNLPELDLPSLAAAALSVPSEAARLSDCLCVSVDKLRSVCPPPKSLASCPGKLTLAAKTRSVLARAKEFAEEVPDRAHPGLIDARHLLAAMASLPDCIPGTRPISRADALSHLASWYNGGSRAGELELLMQRLRQLRSNLLAKVFGQDHAVHAFVEGLFNAEIVGQADEQRKGPRGLFVFAGPPGVGKTYLAELGATALERPFKRFDMSAYSGHEQNEVLIGMPKSYRDSHPGQLTEFVEKNPNAVLLFDEIEKAHANTINMFLQVLDAGILEDKHNERNVPFKDTFIIFTTNAGKRLYDQPNTSGVHGANATFHRRTILDALASEINPRTGEPFFPAAICSRMATGYPLLFNHLGVNELERVVRAELERQGALLEAQHKKKIAFDEAISLCLVLREGANVDARTLRAQAEAFVKTEMFKLFQLFKTDRLSDVLQNLDRIGIGLDTQAGALDSEIQVMLELPDKPRVLLIADNDLADLYAECIDAVIWRSASSPEECLQILADEDIDLVLLDIWLGRSISTPLATLRNFDHAPIGARGLDRGQELLRRIHERLPNTPIFLLSLERSADGGVKQASVDEELFMACVQAGGARGVIASRLLSQDAGAWEVHRDRLEEALLGACQRLHRERSAEKLGRQRKVLAFDTVPSLDQRKREVFIRLRNLRLSRAIAAADAGEMLSDVERPRTRFDDVIGADAAKEEMKFFIDYLKNPRRFAALGLKPPKGILLYGPPGTGKTMLARAMAGESNVAFLPAAASSFVTIWQGSGPQNVRDLFARGRRYAPSIIFIDEIDAIGRTRTGSPGGGQAGEDTLNALLTEMDGFTSPSVDRPVFVLAATNFKVQVESQDSPEKSARSLDPALVRRFSRQILVDLPDRNARKAYFARRVGESKHCAVSEAAIDLLAEKSAGMGISHLESVMDAAARSAVKKNTRITGDILLDALDTARDGEAKPWNPARLERTARHEAGHTVMYWLAGWWSPEVSIIARGDYGGGMRRSEEDLQRESLTRDELLASIRVSLAGRAAELLYYGREGGLSTGASGDLDNATRLAREMICCYGMDDEIGLLVMPHVARHPEAAFMPEHVNQAITKILGQQMDAASRLLEENRDYLDTIVKALIKDNRLYRKDLEQILPPPPLTAV